MDALLTITYFPAIIVVAIAALTVLSRLTRTTVYYAMLSLAMVAWLVPQYIVLITDGQWYAVELTRIAVSLSMILAFWFILFTHQYAVQKPIAGKVVIALLIPILLLTVLSFYDGIIHEIVVSPVGIAIEQFSNLYSAIIFLDMLYFGYGSYLMARAMIKKTGAEKKKDIVLFFAMSQAGILIIATSTILVDNQIAQLLIPSSLLFLVSILSFSIVKHRLFDIKLAAVRSLTYILALISLSGLYYATAYIISITLFRGETSTAVSMSPVNVVLALVLAFIFQPIKQFFDKATNRLFYRDAYNSQVFFAEFSELLASTTELRGLLERASSEITRTFKAEQCFFFLYYPNSILHYMSSGTRNHSRLPFIDAQVLDAYVATKGNGIIVSDELPESSNIRRMLISHRIELVMPLMLKGRSLGYVCLGEQRSRGYNKRDIGVLSTISNELVIAIQNALSVHEIREINATLEQRIKVATKELRESNAQLHRLDEAKDEFVSMASHQLRTPLTSVKGYISMMLDGDVGKITELQRNALEEAFNSSERMVRLISDFLSVSRLQTGKFVIEKKPTDLAKVVQQEIDGLRIIASTHGQKLAYAKPKKIPLIELDEPKIRQVIMNFVDNAIYYSKENTTIHVALGTIGDDVVLTVEDMGIGVPKEQQQKLFSKFYRATNARQQRPDGTGVGLYLAKKVITEHGGKVVFSSVENQGSTFGFRLPFKTSESQG